MRRSKGVKRDFREKVTLPWHVPESHHLPVERKGRALQPVGRPCAEPRSQEGPVQDSEAGSGATPQPGGLKGVCRGCRHYEVPCRASEEQDTDTRMANAAPAGGGGGAGNEPPLWMGRWLVAPGWWEVLGQKGRGPRPW